MGYPYGDSPTGKKSCCPNHPSEVFPLPVGSAVYCNRAVLDGEPSSHAMVYTIAVNPDQLNIFHDRCNS